MFLYVFGATLLGLAFYVWYKFARVPPEIAHLPVIPGLLSKQSERLRVINELAKTQPFARMWLVKWTVFVLHPEYAKIVETSSTLYEKAQSSLPKKSFISRFLGLGTNVVGVQTEDWKRHRAVINPAFDFAYLREFTSVFNSVAEKLLTELSKLEVGSPINAHDWMQRFTLDCLGITAFGFDFGSVTNPNNEYASVYHRLTDVGPNTSGVFSPIRFMAPFGLLDRIPTKENRQLERDIQDWQKLLQKMTKFGETSKDTDLAAHLLKANDPAAQNYMSIEEIRSNIAIFFVAGHETSATSVAATLWYLARYPEVQQRAYDEVVKMCGPNDEPNFDGLKELDYLTQVIYETNRLTPPVRSLPQRVLMEDTQLGDLKLKKGTFVSVSIEALHSLEREWPNPTEFNPDRFSSDAHRHPFSWQPFGAGPRVCLGRSFSILEQRLILAKLLQKFVVGLPPGAPDRIQVADRPGLLRVESRITLLPRIK